ncbi:MAG: SRPBCC family protein [Acidimicrobiales bacterium]
MASTAVAATPATVWSVLVDHGSWPAWFPTVRDVAVTEAAVGVGARRRVRLKSAT